MKTQTLEEFIKETKEEFEGKYYNVEMSDCNTITNYYSTKLQQAGEVAVREERKKFFNTLETCQNHLYSKVDDKDIAFVIRLLENLKEK